MSVHCEKCGQAKYLSSVFKQLESNYDAAQKRIQELEKIKTPGRVEHLLKEKDSRIAELEKVLRRMLESEALKEAPFYNYCESVLEARSVLKGEKK